VTVSLYSITGKLQQLTVGQLVCHAVLHGLRKLFINIAETGMVGISIAEILIEDQPVLTITQSDLAGGQWITVQRDRSA